MCSIYEFKCYIYDIYVKDMHYYLQIWQDFLERHFYWVRMQHIKNQKWQKNYVLLNFLFIKKKLFSTIVIRILEMLKGINDILKYIIIENFHNITVFIVFLVYQQKKTARYDGQSK